MLKIIVPKTELFNDRTMEFYTVPETVLTLEHSLLSISKWECLYKKSFFTKTEKTMDELNDYIKCMTLNSPVDDRVYACLTRDNYKAIGEYLKDPMTARKKYKPREQKKSQFTTSEDIYFNMIMNGIPFECQKWHFNRLMALIDYCNIHGDTSGKMMTKKQQAEMYRDLNASRRAALHSKG